MTALIVIIIIVVGYYLLSKPSKPKIPVSPYQPRNSYPYNKSSFKPPLPRERTSTKRQREPFDPSVIEINDEFKHAIQLVENSHSNVFITGKAGTGKSTLLKYIQHTTKKRMVVLAPTGLAAINVGGQTIHSFFRLPPKLIKVEDIKAPRNAEVIKKLDLVIIDEVSMVRADLMDGLDYVLRICRNQLEVPFGGAQVVFFGDLFQLPPVVKGKDLEQYFNDFYGGPYFFYSRAFKSNPIELLELTKVYRQKEPRFLSLLNRIRERHIDESLFEELNANVNPKLEKVALEKGITLTTTNQAALNINQSFLCAIREQEYGYHAKIMGHYEEADYPTEAHLKLKAGARVMLLRNDIGKKWVNGTLATIATLSNERIVVNVDGTKSDVNLETWEKIEYYYNNEEKKIKERVIGTFQQYPLRLAWAITIHKSQGQTFDNVYIDMGNGAFTHGQTYVALSRCTTFAGIKLRRPVTPKDIIFDPRVYEYHNLRLQQ